MILDSNNMILDRLIEDGEKVKKKVLGLIIGHPGLRFSQEITTYL